MADNVTPIRPPHRSERDVTSALDQLQAGRAILQCYIATIPDERADERYVLWAARDAIDRANSLLD